MFKNRSEKFNHFIDYVIITAAYIPFCAFLFWVGSYFPFKDGPMAGFLFGHGLLAFSWLIWEAWTIPDYMND